MPVSAHCAANSSDSSEPLAITNASGAKSFTTSRRPREWWYPR